MGGLVLMSLSLLCSVPPDCSDVRLGVILISLSKVGTQETWCQQSAKSYAGAMNEHDDECANVMYHFSLILQDGSRSQNQL